MALLDARICLVCDALEAVTSTLVAQHSWVTILQLDSHSCLQSHVFSYVPFCFWLPIGVGIIV